MSAPVQNKCRRDYVRGGKDDTHVDLDVLVLEVEGVLPDVDTNDGDVAKERVLVRSGDDLELLGIRVVAEPAPAGALDGGGDGVELLLERCRIQCQYACWVSGMGKQRHVTEGNCVGDGEGERTCGRKCAFLTRSRRSIVDHMFHGRERCRDEGELLVKETNDWKGETDHQRCQSLQR